MNDARTKRPIRRRDSTPWLLAGLTATALLACGPDGPTGTVCTALAAYGLQVQVRDSITGVPAGRGAAVTAQDGSYQETLAYLGSVYPQDSLTFVGAVERAGVYTVQVAKAGYRAWSRAGVVVTRDACHVIPVTVDARLQPGTD
jgi:hypothetical protein